MTAKPTGRVGDNLTLINTADKMVVIRTEIPKIQNNF